MPEGPTQVGPVIVTGQANNGWSLGFDNGCIYVDENLYDSEPPQIIMMPEIEIDPAFNQQCPNAPQTAAEKKKQVAAMAAQIAREIQSKPDWRRREYTAVIYQGSDGRIYRTPLQAGDLKVVNQAASGGLNLSGIDGSVGYSQILGTVHNHPFEYTNGTTTGIETRDANRRPSMRINSYDPYGDYATADFLTGNDPGAIYGGEMAAPSDSFSMFVIDDEFTMREYPYENLRLPNGSPNPDLGPAVSLNQPICGAS